MFNNSGSAVGSCLKTIVGRIVPSPIRRRMRAVLDWLRSLIIIKEMPLKTNASRAQETSSGFERIPLPPLKLRRLVGRVEDNFYDNTSGGLVLADIPESAYECVFDFGCGCGRIARQLLQQSPRPSRYVGIDIHRGMIQWCRDNLAPSDKRFQFFHHDVYNLGLAPENKRRLTASIDQPSGEFSLVIAWSVFTHLYKEQTEFYLRELARIMREDGIVYSTWFLFDKRDFPMMQEFQVCLFINEIDPTNAVIYDKAWLRGAIRDAGLAIARIVPPAVRGFQWILVLSKWRPNTVEIPFGEEVSVDGFHP